MRKKFLVAFSGDLLILLVSFIICVGLKPGSGKIYYNEYAPSFIMFLFLWIVVSVSLDKYNFQTVSSWTMMLRKILIGNLLIFFIITSMMYLFQSFNYSRFIVLGTVGVATVFELVSAAFYLLIVNARTKYENGSLNYTNTPETIEIARNYAQIEIRNSPKYDFKLREEYLKNEIGNAYEFIKNYAAIDSVNSLIVATTTSFNIDAQIQHQFECIVNVKRVNDFRYINKYFESVNAKLPRGGIYIDFFETKNMRKKRIMDKYPVGFNYMYYALDFLVKRIFPKFTLTKKLYFLLTRGENRVLSKAEALGRLYSCGFEILDERVIDKNFYFVAIKVREPLFPKNPSYGPLIALERIGKGGKIIRVYKMRTMHPFAEYLQDYIYKKGGLQEGGKFRDDFRVTTLGKLMRTFWLDEFPMFINLIKGDLKLFGVRPLSRQYFRLYTMELQRLRILSKPGLIPPFYVDYPKTLDEIVASEMKYLKAYYRHPFRTDWVYFWNAIFNILIRKYRSK
jgi:lipopolysaccharide/colanic/teichoic acid biosynthesis glycosyltransferase